MTKKMTQLTKLVNVSGSDPEETRRRRLLNILLLAIAATTLVLLITLLVSLPTGEAGSPEEMTALFTGIFLTLLAVAIVYLLNRHVSGTLASALFLLLLLAIIALSDEPRQVVTGRGLFGFAIPILASSVLLTSWASFIVAGLSSLVIAIIGLFVVGQAIPNIPAMLSFFVFALVSHLASRSLERALEDLRAANAALRESEKTTRALLDAPTDVAALIDTQGIILDTNETMKDRFQRSLDKLVGACVWDLFPPNVAERRKEHIDRVIQSGQPVRFEDEREGIWNDNVVYPILDRQGKVSRVAILARDITASKQAEQRIAHLNRVLHALRKINQLVVRQKDRAQLLEDVCRNLIETRSYRSAWIVLLDNDEASTDPDRVRSAASADVDRASVDIDHASVDVGRMAAAITENGMEEEFSPLVAQMERGELTRCAQEALKRTGVIVTKAPITDCPDCPVSKNCGDRGAITTQLEHAGRTYGVMTVSAPRTLVTDAEEISLFHEIAEDIAFALRGIEMEEKRRRAEEKIHHLLDRQKTVNRLALALGDTSDLDRIYHTIYEHVQALMDADAFIISFYDEHTQRIHAGYVVTVDVVRDVIAFPPIPLEEKGHGTQSQVIHTGEPVYIPDFRRAMEQTQTEYTIYENGKLIEGPPPSEEADVEQASVDVEQASVDVEQASVDVERASVDVEQASVDVERASVDIDSDRPTDRPPDRRRSASTSAASADEFTQSALCVPMKIEGDTVGVMQVQSNRLAAYSREDIELLSALANVAAIAIQNARLFESLQHSNEELRRHREHLEDLVEERTLELTKMVNLMAGREVRMAELKEVIRQLRAQLEKAGLKPRTDDPLLGEG